MTNGQFQIHSASWCLLWPGWPGSHRSHRGCVTESPSPGLGMLSCWGTLWDPGPQMASCPWVLIADIPSAGRPAALRLEVGVGVSL